MDAVGEVSKECVYFIYFSVYFPPIIPVTLMPQLPMACTVIRNEGMNAETCKDTHIKDPD